MQRQRLKNGLHATNKMYMHGTAALAVLFIFLTIKMLETIMYIIKVLEGHSVKLTKIIAFSLATCFIAGCGAAADTPETVTNIGHEENTLAASVTSTPWPEPDKLIALTFDDGPSTKTMVEVLDLLAEYDAKATFFVIGRQIKDSTMPVMKRAIAEGHEIGNHSMNHVKMAELTEEKILSEYNECQTLVKELFDLDMHFFRAPFGSVDDRMFRLIQAPFMGGFTTGDGTIGSIAADRAWKATSNAYDGAIIVMHCFQGNDETVEALKTILPELKSQGYKFVTLTDLYLESGYELPGPTPGIKIKDNKPIE